MYKKIKKGLKNPLHICEYIQRKFFSTWFKDDRTYIKWNYFFGMGRFPNLDNPQTFNEKLQWLKLHDRRPEYTRMVDKYEAKEYVKEILGEEYIIPTLGVWNKFEDIDFDKLPNQFVLKCTHDSGGLVICQDKSKLDIEKVRKKINNSLKKNFFYAHREYPYKDVKPRIIAEQYITDESGWQLKDYKIFCFNGEPKFIEVDYDRYVEHKLNVYDLNWDFIDFYMTSPNDVNVKIERPKQLDKMLNFARELSKEKTLVRVDFYSIGEKIYFGELTFTPGSGLIVFHPKKWDIILGELLKLPIDTNM